MTINYNSPTKYKPNLAYRFNAVMFTHVHEHAPTLYKIYTYFAGYIFSQKNKKFNICDNLYAVLALHNKIFYISRFYLCTLVLRYK